MLEKFVGRFCDSPTQYRYLLEVEKMVEKRAWVYYGFYCVTVASRLIGFVHFLRKNKPVEETADA